ncbi:Spermidine synthase [Bacillus sp. ZZV12-4809]|nr:Spermidine synthase [Bacillus sp. ZZV12-4809]
MGFVLLIFLAWLVIMIFTSMNKKLTFVENTFVYLAAMVIHINYTWIVYEELNEAHISQQILNNSAFLVHRSITLPITIAITFNLLRTADSLGSKFIKIAVSVAFLASAVMIARYFEIVEFKKWKIVYEIIYLFLLHFAMLYLLKYFRQLKTRGVNEA